MISDSISLIFNIFNCTIRPKKVINNENQTDNKPFNNIARPDRL